MINKKELYRLIKTKYHYDDDDFYINYNNKKVRVNYFDKNLTVGFKVSVYIVDWEPYDWDYQFSSKKDTVDFLYDYLNK